MRRATLFLIAALALIFALTSCQTAKVEQEPQVVEIILRIEIVDVPAEKPASEEPALVEEPVVISEPEVTEESVVASEPEVVWTVGETGPNGGLVFECEGR